MLSEKKISKNDEVKRLLANTPHRSSRSMLSSPEKHCQAAQWTATKPTSRKYHRDLLPHEISSRQFTGIPQRAIPSFIKLPCLLSLAHLANVASAASQMLYQETESALPVEKIRRRHWLSPKFLPSDDSRTRRGSNANSAYSRRSIEEAVLGCRVRSPDQRGLSPSMRA